MRIRPLAALLCAVVAFAQDGARGLALFGLASRPNLRWRLVCEAPPPGRVLPQVQDLRFLQLRAAGLGFARVPLASLRSQAAQCGLDPGEIRWLLLDPGGKERAHGPGSWELETIEAVIREVQGELPWDHLERMLRDRPDHGEARLARLEWTVALASPQDGIREAGGSRFEADPRWAQGLIADAMAGLRKLPDWPWQVPLASPGLGRRLLAGLGTETCFDLSKELTEALARDPANPLLQENLALVHGTFPSEKLDASAERWEAVEPLPGQLWPPLRLVRSHLDRLLASGRMPEARFKAQSWSRPADRLFLEASSWKHRVQREAWLVTYGCVAETHLENTQAIILESLDRIRDGAGPAFRELTRFYLDRIPFQDDPEFRKRMLELAARPALPLQPMPEPLPPWQLTLADRAGLPALRSAFNEDRDLVLWLPTERGIGWLPGQLRPFEARLGREIVFAPPAPPSRLQLVEELGRGRRGRLRSATDHLERAPDHPGRRRFRIPLLEERGWVKPLEHVLAEDLRRVGTCIDLANYPFDANLWWSEAQRAAPELEATLRRWPLDGERWGALAFWSGFLPNHPGPAALADSQPSWQPRLPFHLALPPSAHDRVGEQLLRRRAWTQLRAWFEPAWEALRSLRAEDFKRWPWLLATAATTRSHLDQAYASLALDGPRRALKETWEAMQSRSQPPP